MSRKNVFLAIAGFLGVLALFAGISRSAQAGSSYAPIDLNVQLAPNVTLHNVFIGEDRSVNVDGRAVESAGSCMPVNVFIEGEREPWWPVYRCLQVSDTGEWSLRIPSDDGGSPMSINLQVGE